MAKEKEKPKNPIDQIMSKKIKQYEELLEEFDKLHEYLKPIVGNDNKEVNELIASIRTKLVCLPLVDMIQGTLQAGLGMAMMGEQFKKVQEDFNEAFANREGGKDFEKFIKENDKR